MSYVDLGTVSAKSEQKRRKKSIWKFSPKLILLAVLFIIAGICLRFFTSSATTVLAEFWSTSGKVISFMIPGAPHILEDQGVTNVLLVGIDKRSEMPYSYQTTDGQVVNIEAGTPIGLLLALTYSSQSSVISTIWTDVPKAT